MNCSADFRISMIQKGMRFSQADENRMKLLEQRLIVFYYVLSKTRSISVTILVVSWSLSKS
jgi:hypothetical protein